MWLVEMTFSPGPACDSIGSAKDTDLFIFWTRRASRDMEFYL